jgi:hypothetical protein
MKLGSIVLLCAALALSACNDNKNNTDAQPGNGGSITPTPTPAPTHTTASALYTLAVDPNPIRATPSLDSARAVTQTVTTAGGTLVAYGPDGTTYTLTVPDNALVADVSITMTPLSALDGLPMGDGPMRGVEFAPDGLQFINPVTLAITLPATQVWPVDQQIPVSYRGATSVVSLAALDSASQDAKYKLMHFSGYALLLATKGINASLAGLRNRLGGSAEERIASAAGERLARERQKQLLGTGSPEEVVLDDLEKEYEMEVLNPRLAAAGNSCAASRLAIQTLLSYEREGQLLFGKSRVPDATTKLAQLMDVAEPLCMKEEYEICRDAHIIHRILPTWLGIGRQYQLLFGNPSAVHEQTKQYVTRCLNFELQLQSEATSDATGLYTRSVVEATVKLPFNFEGLHASGSAPLVNTIFEVTETTDCTVTSMRGGATFSASDLSFIVGEGAPQNSPLAVSDVKLNYFPGVTTENVHSVCPGNPPFVIDLNLGGWTGEFLVTHEKEYFPDLGGFVATNWNILGGELFAQKVWSFSTSVKATRIAESGNFKLYHRPL